MHEFVVTAVSANGLKESALTAQTVLSAQNMQMAEIRANDGICAKARIQAFLLFSPLEFSTRGRNQRKSLKL
jgi:hypothetical protein